MARDLTAQITLTAEASGVEATVGRVKRNLADLGITGATAGKDAAKGLDATAQAAENAKNRVKSLQEAIERVRVAEATGGAASAESFALKGFHKRIGLDSIAPQIAQLEQERAKRLEVAAAAQVQAQAAKDAAQASARGQSFVEDLRNQVATLNLGEGALLRYKAAQAGVAAESAPLIAQLEAMRAATAAKAQADRDAAAAAKAQAAAQEQAAAVAARQVESQQAFIASLRDQLATLNLGEGELLRYRAAQAGVGATASPLILQLENIRAATLAKADADRDAAAAAQQQAAALKQQAASQQAFLAGLREQVATQNLDQQGRLSRQARGLGLSQKDLSEADLLIGQLNKLDPALKKTGIAFNEYGISAKQTAAALRQVPAQLTDIFVSLQGGQAPLTVLLQQGGQLKDIFGGVVPAAKALGSAVLGLINPFTVLAAAAVAVGLAYKQGSAEADEYAKALILSGNATGTTVSQLNEMAKAITGVTGTQGAAADALAQFAASGDVASENLQKVAAAAVRFERVTGQAVSKTVEQFSALAKEPLTASLKLNETTRFLTLSVYQQIRALEEQGRVVEAATVAQNAYADAVDSRTRQLEERLGYFQERWRLLGREAAYAWDLMLGIGRAKTLDEQLASAQQALAQAESTPNLGPEFGGSSEAAQASALAAMRARVDALREQIGAEKGAATEAAKGAKQLEARIELDKLKLRYIDEETRKTNALTEATNRLVAAGVAPDSKEFKDTLAAVRARFDKKGGSPRAASTATPLDTGKSELTAQIALIKNQLDQEVNAYRNADSIIEAMRSANLLKEADYYERKREFILQTEQANATAAASEQAALEAERSRLEAKRAIVKTDNDRTRVDREIIDINRKIEDSENKRLEAAAKASTQIVILNLQEKASRDRLTDSYIESQKAAENLLRTFQLRQDRAVQSVGQGDRRRDFTAGLNDIEDRASQRRQQLESERRTGQYRGNEEAYRRELELLERTKQAELEIYTRGFNAIEQAQGNFANGANRALENYLDSIRDVATEMERVFDKAFSGLEDTLTDFFTTGKLDVRSFATSIVSDINRIIVRQNITGPLAKTIQEGFGSGEGIGGLLKRGLGDLIGGGAKPGFAINGNPLDFGAGAADTAAKAAATAATTAHTVAVTADAAAITAATTASVSSATSLAALSAAATTAAAALATVGATSSVPAFGKLLGSFGFGTPMATGTNYVPHDGFLARLHKGEAVVPAKYNPAAGGSAKSVVITINQTFDKNTSRATVEQAARMAGATVQRAAARGTS